MTIGCLLCVFIDLNLVSMAMVDYNLKYCALDAHHMNRCSLDQFEPLLGLLVLIAAGNIRPMMLAKNRAATRLCVWVIGCVRAADVGLLTGPPWSIVDVVMEVGVV